MQPGQQSFILKYSKEYMIKPQDKRKLTTGVIHHVKIAPTHQSQLH